MRVIYSSLIFLVVILSIVSVSANGCCFYPTTGVCSPNVPMGSCEGDLGVFKSDPTCASVSECNIGCCVLGASSAHVTEGTCYFESLVRGFMPYSWVGGTTRSQCLGMSGASNLGACVFNDKFDTKCTFVERGRCPANFYEGVLCTDSSIESSCEKTGNTFCHSGSVYFKDSCNNRDELKQECNYNEGFICETKNSKEAYCKNLNCVDNLGNTRKNGESWCIGLDGNVLLEDVRATLFTSPVSKLSGFNDVVGSESFKQTCLEGEIVTEQCGIYRSEVCIPSEGSARCVANLGGDCFMSTPDESNSFDDSWKEECDPEWCYIYDLFDSDTPLWKDLGLATCMPKVSRGAEVSLENSKSSTSGCELGDFEGYGAMRHFKKSKKWKIFSDSNIGSEIDFHNGNYGYIGLISTLLNSWKFEEKKQLISWCKDTSDNPLFSIMGTNWCGKHPFFEENLFGMRSSSNQSLLPNPEVEEFLNKRAIGLGDCAGSSNWKSSLSSIDNLLVFSVSRGESGKKKTIKFSLKFTTRSWRPQAGGEDCSLCGSDGLPCTEYRCNVLGKRCEYVEPRGIDTGTCVSSEDMSPPSISHSQGPSNPLPPYSSVLITLNTDKDSYCKFDLSSQGGSFEGLRYETDRKFGKFHSFYLSVPGRVREDEDVEHYAILTRDGTYQIFVRCEDAAGNFNIEPYMVDLEVMDTPDRIPAGILEFIPSSSSYTLFNTSSKEIRFRIDEPAECRWDFEDKSYDAMGTTIIEEEEEDEEDWVGDDFDEEDVEEILDESPLTSNTNQFACDTEIYEGGFAEGYWCSGVLNGVNTTYGESTKYYIRCRDQPWLEGNEDEYYKRNDDYKGTEYVLRASRPLKIKEVRPTSGDFVISPSMSNVTYRVETSEGSENGKSICSWRFKTGDLTTAWQTFDKTNSSVHEHVLTSLQTYNYLVEIRCSDVAGNIVEGNYTMNVIRDLSPPEFIRVFNDRGTVRVVLSEPGSCKFSLNSGCYNVLSNGTELTPERGGIQFSTALKKGMLYYFRCEDVYGNSACLGDIFFH